MVLTNTSLREIVDQRSAMAKTKRLDLSFNELLDMYNNKELEIQPAFQRIFVWNIVKESQFIESLLLELPVPPIYVVEEEEGRYVLVDGLQRLSTYFHFRGVLQNSKREIKRGEHFALEGCDIVKELNGKAWPDLETTLQIRLKRAFVSVQVIRKESDSSLKFHLFKRLNDGGTQVSPQQVRNCVVRMLDGGEKVMEFIEKMASTPEFESICVELLTEEQRNQQFDQELVLRFLALKNIRDQFKHDVGPFIDIFVEGISGSEDTVIPFDFQKEEEIFLKTFSVLNKSTGERSFTSAGKSSTLTKGFSVYHFEGVALGVQPCLNKLNPDDDDQMKRLKVALENARQSAEFRVVSSGGGKNSSGVLKKRIEIIEAAVITAV